VSYVDSFSVIHLVDLLSGPPRTHKSSPLLDELLLLQVSLLLVPLSGLSPECETKPFGPILYPREPPRHSSSQYSAFPPLPVSQRLTVVFRFDDCPNWVLSVPRTPSFGAFTLFPVLNQQADTSHTNKLSPLFLKPLCPLYIFRCPLKRRFKRSSTHRERKLVPASFLCRVDGICFLLYSRYDVDPLVLSLNRTCRSILFFLPTLASHFLHI